MPKKTKGLIMACAAVLMAVAPVFSATTGDIPLIPRDILFGNPVKASPRLSPCGMRLAYLAPSDKGVLNVWVRTIGKEDDAQVTNDTHRGIRIHFWAEDGKRLFYLQDLGGDENFHVYSVDLATKVVRDLTPFQGVRASNIMLDKKFPGQMLVGLNLRDRRVFDMYRVDLNSGAITLDTENPGDVLGWVTDPDFQIRACQAQNPQDASNITRVRDSRDAPWRDLVILPFGENGGVIDFCADGKSLYFQTSIGADTARLVRIDAVTGKELETIARDPKSDLAGAFVHPDTKKVQAVAFSYLKNEWRVLDPSIKEDFAALAKLGRGEFYPGGRDRADTKWLVTYQVDDGPVAWYAYDRASKKAELLFFNQPDLAKYKLARMEPVVIKARDGFQLVSYLTLPVGSQGKNLPLVLNVHGGPWARDGWGYDPEAQWLANRGYATLQVNFRGSTGFGKKFLNAGNGQWGVGTMQHDLTDAVRWAIKQGIADPKRVCIYGGSYGGYATLAGLVFTPELYSCGVDIVGPSNIKTLMASIPPYWAPMKKQMILRIGDIENDEAFNKKISPLFHADNIRVPLIVAQGANDPRVNIREADQIVKAMRDKNLPVTYVVYTDEGHGFARPNNRLDFYGRVDEFLAKHLGGRSEPWQKIEGTSAEVR
ncbi:MAG: S9 family peptidase [Acidobacteria bacterium]|jgi:dipeptidyl aminopeptidase/acylaminoacyl peptidase|nr:S9 family peptidase [Acidobacteriota bacterium]